MAAQFPGNDHFQFAPPKTALKARTDLRDLQFCMRNSDAKFAGKPGYLLRLRKTLILRFSDCEPGQAITLATFSRIALFGCELRKSERAGSKASHFPSGNSAAI